MTLRNLFRELIPAKDTAPVSGAPPGLAMGLSAELGIASVSLKTEAHAMDIIASNLKDDIEDAYIFHRKLIRYVGEESKLKERVLVSTRKADYTLDTFEKHLQAHGSRRALTRLLGDRDRVQKLLEPLQASQSQLARRIDWMRAALSDLDKNFDPSKDQEELASSVPPNERPGWVDEQK